MDGITAPDQRVRGGLVRTRIIGRGGPPRDRPDQAGRGGASIPTRLFECEL